MKKLILLAAIALLSLSALQAQNTCGDQLKVAQRRFDDGLLDDIPQLLANCMRSGFTNEEKKNAYKLLIQTYLFSDNQKKADEVMLKFLNEFPSYSIAVNDPKEFINLYGTYRTKPIFRIEGKIGANFCMPGLVEPYGTGNIAKIKPTYKTKLGYYGELNFINTLYKNFDYSLGVSYSVSNYNYTNKPNIYSTITAVFNNSYIGIPIAVRYNYNLKGINLFARVGIEPVYLLASNVTLTRTDNNVGRQDPITGSENLLSSHKRLDIRPLFAFGVSIKFLGGWLNPSVGFKFSMLAQLNSKFYSNSLLSSKYFFAEDKLLLNQAHVSISYIRPIYKPKKIR
jgi:hypothetical protein